MAAVVVALCKAGTVIYGAVAVVHVVHQAVYVTPHSSFLQQEQQQHETQHGEEEEKCTSNRRVDDDITH